MSQIGTQRSCQPILIRRTSRGPRALRIAEARRDVRGPAGVWPQKGPPGQPDATVTASASARCRAVAPVMARATASTNTADAKGGQRCKRRRWLRAVLIDAAHLIFRSSRSDVTPRRWVTNRSRRKFRIPWLCGTAARQLDAPRTPCSAPVVCSIRLFACTRATIRVCVVRVVVPNPSSMSMIVRTLGRGCSLLARKLFRRQVEAMAPEWAIGTQARAARLRISCIAAMEAAAQSHLSRRASQAIPMLPRGTSFLDAEVLAAESPALRHGRRSRQPRCLLIFCTASRGSARRKLGHGLPTPKWRARRLYLPPALR
jgi:hypothetical protein